MALVRACLGAAASYRVVLAPAATIGRDTLGAVLRTEARQLIGIVSNHHSCATWWLCRCGVCAREGRRQHDGHQRHAHDDEQHHGAPRRRHRCHRQSVSGYAAGQGSLPRHHTLQRILHGTPNTVVEALVVMAMLRCVAQPREKEGASVRVCEREQANELSSVMNGNGNGNAQCLCDGNPPNECRASHPPSAPAPSCHHWIAIIYSHSLTHSKKYNAASRSISTARSKLPVLLMQTG